MRPHYDAKAALRRARLELNRASHGLQQTAQQRTQGATFGEVALLAGLDKRCMKALERGRLRGAPLHALEAAATALELSPRDRTLLLHDAMPRRKPLGKLRPIDRLVMWFDASSEIHDLTRNRAQEQRVLNEAATAWMPGPWSIAMLFRRRPHPCDQHKQTPI